ncbi:hypothetical protein F2Q69_00023147 [Brassica cretica]|uniref:Uncharacterized protein n=1 Tax=Brassica cretica TaxID=69181 RepID=A0A8S9Q3D1_BRACR|nr:hypothetical protein F2Q69_00023147 [Brassica cretica]
MPKIDVTRLNALRPQTKPLANPPETTITHSDDAAEPMKVDKAPMGRTLRKRKGKVAKETRETEEDIRRMFCEAREKMKNKITLKKKSDPRKFAVPCTVKGIEFPHALCDTGASASILPRVMTYHLSLKVEPSKESFTFVDCSQRSSGGIVRDLESLFVNNRSGVQHANQPVVPDAHRSTSEYEIEYSASIETHTATSIDSAHKKSINIPKEESVDSSPEDWENDYYNPTMATHTRDTLHTEENAPPIDRTVSTSIDTHLHQTSRQRVSTDIAYYQSINTGVDRAREGDYSILAVGQMITITKAMQRPEFGKRAYDHGGTRRFHWEEKDEYGVYRDDYGHARDVDGHIIRVSKDNIRSLLERASVDEHSYLCLTEHARSFTQTKIVPEIYTKDEISEMFYGVCGAQEKHEGDFRMKLDGVYYPLNDNISWLTTCMEEKRQDITKIQTQRAAEATAAAIQREIVEIQKYIARRPEASASIDRRNNKSTDSHKRTSVDEATNRGRLVPRVKSDMSDTHNHGEEISADTYTTLMRHQFNLESLGDRLQKIENTTASMKEKWRIRDEAM